MKYTVIVVLIWSAGEASCSQRHERKPASFSKQVATLLESIKMPADDLAKMSLILRDVERALSTRWPGCKVKPFGSTVTGLALVGSDVDAYVLLPDRTIRSQGPINYEAARVLAQFPNYAENITPSAFYITFPHVPTHTKVDLQFNNMEGGRNSELIGYILNLEERIHSLAILVKYWWDKVQKMTRYKMVPNYGMSVMVIFYLQQLDMIPPIATMQKNAEPFIYENWNSGFDSIDYKPRNNNSLYQLLGEFFEYYNDFNYDEYIISPFVGRPIKRELFKDMSTVPDELEFYRRNVAENIEAPIVLTDEIIIQDVFLHNKNLAETIMELNAAERAPFYLEFNRLALNYKQSNESVFLDEVLSVDISKFKPN